MFHIEVENDVSILKINDGKVNAMDVELIDTFLNSLREIRSGGAKSLVVTGEKNNFSAGVNLQRVLTEGTDYLRVFVPKLSELFVSLLQFEIPVIAAINGHAIAGGCLLAACCDYRIMSEGQGRIGITELKVGVPFPNSAFEIMRHIVHRGYFNEVLYLGRLYTPGEALERGLVNEVCSPADMMDASTQVARVLGSVPQKAFAITKKQRVAPIVDYCKEQEKELDQEVLNYWLSNEALENITRFMQKLKKS